MALQIEIPGYKSAYHRIHAMDIDEDNMKAILRVKVYANKNARTKGNLDIREARCEISLTRKAFIDLVLPEAEQAAKDSKECKAQQKAEVESIEKAIEEHKKNSEKKEKVPPLSEADKRRIHETVLNRHISLKQKELADRAIGDLMKRFGGTESIKAVAYEMMKMFPQYAGAKNV